MPQSRTAAKLWHQEEKKMDKNQCMQNKQTNAWEAYRPALSFTREVIAMLNIYIFIVIALNETSILVAVQFSVQNIYESWSRLRLVAE